MRKLNPRVFVDFDGTITTKDVGNAFFRKFGDETRSVELVSKWKAEEISGRELMAGEAGSVRVEKEQAVEFISGFELVDGFKDFLKFCKENSIPILVVSDGLDFYIEEIFRRNQIFELPFVSNHAVFVDSKIKVEFPYESSCTKCANCKAFHILTNSSDDEAIVYIGNGFSDRCAVEYSDVVFAKDDLLKYCEEKNITYFPFETFHDVLKKFGKIYKSGGFRKRHRAEMKRREAYLSE
ncbi:MAG: MtnX-like HAD-IB family phosphatase [Candidatus Kryptoniota bacterium]